MSEETELRIHPLRQASVYILAPLILMDTFLLLFTTTLLCEKLDPIQGPIVAGIVGAVYPAVNMVFELFWGWLADKVGRRIPIILGGLFTIPGILIFVFATEPWQLIIGAAVRGIGGSAGIPLSKALAADLAPRKVLGERMGAWTMAMYAAPLIGLSLAGPLWDIWDRLPFLTAAVTELVCVLLAIFAIPETIILRNRVHRKAKEARPSSKIDRFKKGAGEWLAILKRRGVLVSAFTTLMAYAGSTAASTIAFPLYAAGLGLSGTQISLVYTLGLIIPILGLVPGGAFCDKYGRKWPAVLGGICAALTWPLYVFVPGMASPFLGFALIHIISSVTSCFREPALISYMFSWVRRSEAGRASAVTEFFRDFGTVVGLPLIGYIYKMLSPETAFYYACIVGVITYLIVLVIWKEPPPVEELEG